MKVKTITVELTEREVSVLEDMLFAEVDEEFLTNTFAVRTSLWKKIASQFDEELKK